MSRTVEQRKYHVLLKQAALSEEEKLAMLAGYGVESSKALSDVQLIEINEALARQVESRYNAPVAVRRLRSKVIDFLVSLGYYKPGGSWDRANAFLEQKRVAGKRLYLLDEQALKALIKKLAVICKKKNAAMEAENEIAPWN